MIQLKNVSKNFGQQKVLKNVQLVVNQGEQCVIQGRSGSGKSTLLYLIGGMEQCSEGEIHCYQKPLHRFNDHELASYRKAYIGFVFQFHFLLPTMTALDNITLPLKLSGKTMLRDKVEQLAKEVGLQNCLDKYPYQLSGGEQQRISLLRAVVVEPPLLLCDEPTGNLDRTNGEKVVELLQYFAKKLQSTLLVVTHDHDVSAKFARKIRIEDGSLFS